MACAVSAATWEKAGSAYLVQKDMLTATKLQSLTCILCQRYA